MSLPERLHLRLQEQADLAAMGHQLAADLAQTVALVPAIAVWAARTAGPQYERLEAAVKHASLAPPPIERRILLLWEIINSLHNVLLLSLRDLCLNQACGAVFALRKNGEEDIIEAFSQPGDDLLAAAELGALRAIRRYDPAEGTQLGMYAKIWILKSIKESIAVARKAPAGRRSSRLPLWVERGDPSEGPSIDLADASLTIEDAIVERETRDETRKAHLDEMRRALVSLSLFDAPAADAVSISLRFTRGKYLTADRERGVEWLQQLTALRRRSEREAASASLT